MNISSFSKVALVSVFLSTIALASASAPQGKQFHSNHNRRLAGNLPPGNNQPAGNRMCANAKDSIWVSRRETCVKCSSIDPNTVPDSAQSSCVACVKPSKPNTAGTACVTPTTTQAKPITGGTWVLMVRQTKGFWFTPALAASGQYNTNNPSAPNYCNLAALETHRINGVLTLKMTWPGLLDQDQVWKQTSNPFKTKQRGVTGYVAVTTPYKEFWGGLEWNGKEAILDGSPDHPYFFYEVGAFMPFQGGIAGPLQVVDKMELWVLGRASATTTTTTVTPRPPSPVIGARPKTLPSYWPCRVMSQKICETSPRCVFASAQCQCKDYMADFIFGLDSSTQVGGNGFLYEKNLLTTIMLNLPMNSRVAVMTSDMKGDVTHTPKMVVNLQSNAVAARMAVHTIEYANGHLSVGRMVQTALSVFEASSTSRKMKRLVLFMGGNDMGTANACAMQTKLRAAGVQVIVIGVGNTFEAGKVQCLAGTSEYIIQTKRWNSNQFGQAWNAINDLICPRVQGEMR